MERKRVANGRLRADLLPDGLKWPSYREGLRGISVTRTSSSSGPRRRRRRRQRTNSDRGEAEEARPQTKKYMRNTEMRNRTRTRPCYFLLLGGGSRTMPKASSERSGLLINQNACILAMAIA